MSETTQLPAEFKAGGKTFRLTINYGQARDLRRHNGVDLIDYHNGSAIKLFAEDQDKIFETIWKLCEKQARDLGLDEAKFAELFISGVFEEAYSALEEAIVNFTPPAKRPVILAICKKSKEIQAKQAELAVAKINSPKADQMINAAVEQTAKQMDQQLDQQTGKLTSGN